MLTDIRLWLLLLALVGIFMGIFANAIVVIVLSVIAIAVAGFFIIMSFRSDYSLDAVGLNIFCISVAGLSLFLVPTWVGFLLR